MSGLATNWLVVGLGSDLGGDDRFGLEVAQAVTQIVAQTVSEAVTEQQVNVTVLTARILGPELVENIRAASAVIFVDASAALAPGVLQCIDLQDQSQAGQEYKVAKGDTERRAQSNQNEDNKTKQNSSAIAMSHHCDPRTLIQLSETLCGTRTPAWLFVVGGSDFALSESMSAAVAALVPEVAARIVGLLSAAPA
jgi:Ni,Fe-hydrogenase maturation factor